ncbi:hypothetical protein C8J57DRAFT_1254119 [Mycena rebaudengoi]|nr:hypothetical protein C8J57DRAFT_1254119 [Mycena rebaudengoi]
MEASPAAAVHPAFPEDLERVITEVLLNDTRDMCGTMSLVASRFHSWTTPFRFHTVAVRVRKICMRRLRHWVLPNAQFTQILVLDLPFKEGPRRGQWPDKMLACSRRLLVASGSVRHLARLASEKPLPDTGGNDHGRGFTADDGHLPWHLPFSLYPKNSRHKALEELGHPRTFYLVGNGEKYLFWVMHTGTSQIATQSFNSIMLYGQIQVSVICHEPAPTVVAPSVIWDGAWYTSPPTLHGLQHPAALVHLTVSAPPDLRRPTTYQRCGLCYVPELAHCVNLAYLTYACKRVIRSGVADLRLKGTMLVHLCLGPHDLGWIKMRHLEEVLAEWIAKAEGRESLLDHVVATPGPGVEFQATDRVD